MPSDRPTNPGSAPTKRSKAFDREIRDLAEEADAAFQRLARRTGKRLADKRQESALAKKFEDQN